MQLQLFVCLVTIALSVNCVAAIVSTISNMLKSVKDFGTDIANDVESMVTSVKEIIAGIVRDAGNWLPTAQGLFDVAKQLIVGYPFELVSSSINVICSSALASKAVLPKVTPNIHAMHFQLRTACSKYIFPILKAADMWKSPEFNNRQKVVIFVTGWNTNVNDTAAIEEFSRAYNCRGNVTFVAVDAAKFVDTLYTWSAFNTEEVGRHVAKGLVQLSNVVRLENIHLIGHSLGAHIAGAAGRHFFYMTGKTISRITGLDPAKPCFNEGELLSGLMRGDADFIDVIHSNCGVLGKRDPMGDVDFYPGGMDPLPPGCVSVACAHSRAWEYYAESIYPGNEENFKAHRCSSLTRLREKKCPGKSFPMGYAAEAASKGNYFLDVNDESPFGQNAVQDRSLMYTHCGLCKNSEQIANY